MLSIILIPIHNRKKITLNCLSHLQNIGDLDNYQVVIIDDGSSDGTKEAIENKFPQVKILNGNGNLWWTGAIALGMTYALKQKAQYIFWLNDDCLPVADSIFKMQKFLQNYPQAIVGASCRYASSDGIIDTGFIGRQKTSAIEHDYLLVDGLSGFLVGMTRSVPEQIGLPDSRRFPHYAGDTAYTLLASRSGIPVYLMSSAQAIITDKTHNSGSLISYFQSLSAPNWKNIFINKKSPFRLQTCFYLYQLKYIFPMYLFIMVAKFIQWQAIWLFYIIRLSISNSRFSK